MEKFNSKIESSEERKVIGYEDYINKLSVVLNNAEDGFYKNNNRYPDLTDENDYIALSDFLNMEDQGDIFGDSERETFPNRFEKINEAGRLLSHDLANLLIKRFIQRKGFFAGENQDKILQVLMGDSYYRVPKSEYSSRINIVDNFVKNQIPFPDDWIQFIQELEKINKTCFLKDSYEKNKDGYKKGYGKIGTYLVNPIGGIIRNVRTQRSWEDLISILEYYKNF